ncbi:suppressor of cytokine signaling 3-like [Cetorhinus maximus]
MSGDLTETAQFVQSSRSLDRGAALSLLQSLLLFTGQVSFDLPEFSQEPASEFPVSKYGALSVFFWARNWRWKSLAEGGAGDVNRTGGVGGEEEGAARERLEPEDGQEAGYRFRAFAGGYERVEGALARLESSGFYWAALSGAEASWRLAGQPVGTFLLRDSADPRHLFTLSVRTEAGITNLRVRQRRPAGSGEVEGERGGAFYLETEGGGPATPAATYDCVVKLADHYVRLSGQGAALVRRQGGRGRGHHPLPLLLRRPLLCKVPALQDLCRRALNLHLAGVGRDARGRLEALPLPSSLRDSLRD